MNIQIRLSFETFSTDVTFEVPLFIVRNEVILQAFCVFESLLTNSANTWFLAVMTRELFLRLAHL